MKQLVWSQFASELGLLSKTIIQKKDTPGFYPPGYVIKTLLNYLRKVSNQRLDLEFIMGFQIIKIGFGIFQILFTISDMNQNATLL